MKPLITFRQAIAELLAQPREQIVLQLSALILLLQTLETGRWTLEVVMIAICGSMLVSPLLCRGPEIWFLVCAVIGWSFLNDYLAAPNHRFLIAFWCLACALAATSSAPARVLAHNGRIMIGLCFVFAVFWKFRNPSYLDGSFMEHAILTGFMDNLGLAAAYLGCLSQAQMVRNHECEAAFLASPDVLFSEPLETTIALHVIAHVVTWLTLIAEIVVAVAFLTTRPRWVERWRDWALLFFLYSVYPFLPVAYFAHVLGVMGIAQCHPSRRRTMTAYLLSFPVIQLARVPWFG
jgi:hypothetical protein